MLQVMAHKSNVETRVTQNKKFYAMFVVLVIIAGALFTPLVSSLLSNPVTIRSSGQIILPYVTAASGSGNNIQAAVDWVVAHGGNGDVHIPEGTFNFVEVGEPWQTVTIPAGVNIFGASTQRDTDNQVTSWRTVLVMPWDVPGGGGVGIPYWFEIEGNSDPDKPSRFSDIKLVGYRSINSGSTSMHKAIGISNVMDFRVDHCYFEHTCGGGIVTSGHYCRGVIDHNSFINNYGIPDPYGSRTVGYAIFPSRSSPEYEWEPIENILGKYTAYTVFIEDNYFTKWRHVVAGNFGVHYVFRYNTIEHGFAYGEIDAHPVYTGVPNRAVESYENTIKDPDPYGVINWAHTIKGGSGVIFNNVVTGYNLLAFLYDCEDFYIWGNTNNNIDYSPSAVTEGVDYFLYEPEWYTPYQYPHPLTLE